MLLVLLDKAEAQAMKLSGRFAEARELRGGSTPFIARSEEEWRAYVIDWSLEEAMTMLRKMRDRWNQEKGVLTGFLGAHFAPPGYDIAGRFIDWVRLLAEVILPRLAEADNEPKELARSLIEELEEAGVHVYYAAPALLYLDIGQLDGSSKRLWRGMQSQDRREVGEAIRGVVLWLMLRARGVQIPPPPDHLLDEVVNRIIARRLPGLDWAMVHLANLLSLHPEQLEARHLEGTCVGLRYLIEDTHLPNTEERRDSGALPSPIPLGDKPKYRALGSSLASHLYYRYTELNKPIPEILELWKQVGNNDTLPEVRKAWWD